VFSEDLAISMLETTESLLPDLGLRHDALRKCIVELPDTSRDMIRRRYEDGATLLQISQQLNRTENAVKFALVRIRKSLAKSIQKRISLGN
jgi:DNA-directed RNA polymerase specialized sigma24 family protein